VQRVIERGERLDETKPGSGLGLGIVKEIASLYGGKLTLGRAATGGLAVELDLPSAERAA
jgi:signal transduction histidine kinase